MKYLQSIINNEKLIFLVFPFLCLSWRLFIPNEFLGNGVFFQDDFYYYLKLGENFWKYGFFTFDGINTTNGFQPLWQFIIIIISLFFEGDSLVKASLLLNLLLTILFFYFFLKLIKKLKLPIFPLVLSIIALISFPSLGQYLFNGMETALAAFLIVLSFLYFIKLNEKEISYKDSIYFHVSFNNQLVIDNIIDRFNIQFDKVKSTLNISFKHQDSYVAAQVIEFSAKYLNGYISGFEMNEQRKTYNFISNQLSILEEEYKHAQKKLVEFQDNNMNLVTNSAMSVEIDLKSKRDLAFDLYSSLQKRKQELEIDLASNPTHLKTLGKTQIPVKKASASKKTIVALYLFLGLFLSLCYLLLRHFIIPNFS